MAKQLNVNLGFTADTSQAAAQIQNLQNQLTGLLNSTNGSMNFGSKVVGDVNKASKAIAELKMHLKNATNVNTGALDFTKLNESIGKSGMTLQQYGDKLRGLGPAGQQAFNALANSVAQSEIPIRRSNAALTEMWTTLKNTARWQISSSILHGFMGSISAAVGYAKDLNRSLNDIRIVTGASVDQMAQFAEQANRSAKALSASTTEYTKASLIYYQQGLDDQAVKERTDVTIKMANVSGQTAETVSDQMTAVWNNFAKGGEDLERFADVMVRLGADTASSSDEIAQGLEKFAAIGDMVGLSFDNAAAALATVTATTRQSAEVVGTAFKTIFARIQGLQLGETLEDGTTLNKYSEALATVGISIKEQNGELKDMDTILAEMGAKWQTLSKDQQVALAQTVAGVRQYNQLVALMDNFDFYEQNLDRAATAEGSLQEQADIYAESWQAASARVKAATQGIYEDLLDDEAFIDVLNIIEKILTYIDNLIDGLGGLGGVLTTVGALLTRAFSSQIAQSMTGMVNGLKSMTATGREHAQQQKAQFMSDAADAMRNTADGSNEGNTRAAVMEDQLRLQTSMIENSEKMSMEEQEINKMLLDRQRILGENAIAAAKAQDAAVEKRSDATFNARVELAQEARGWSGGDLEVEKQNLKDFTKQFNDVQQKLKQGITARVQLNELRKLPTEGEKAKQAMEKIKQAVDKIDDSEIQEIIGSLDSMEANAETVESAIAQLTMRLQEMQQTTESGMMDENSEWMLSEDAVRGLSEAYEEEAGAAIRAKDAEDQANDARDEAANSINNAKGAQAGWADQMVTGANMVMSLMSALQALNGIIDVASNPDMSGWEKFLSIGSSLAMMFVMLAPLLQGTNLQFLTMAATSIAGAFGVKTFSAAEMEAALSGNVAAAGTATFATALWSLLWPIGLVIAAIAALVGIIALIGNEINNNKIASLEGQLESAKNASEEFGRMLNEAQQEAQSLQDAFNQYDSVMDTLKGCEKGTEEWKKALQAVNTEVLNLLENYPELMNYVDANGQSGIYRDETTGVLAVNENFFVDQQNKIANQVEKATMAKLMSDRRAADLTVDIATKNFQDIMAHQGHDINPFLHSEGDGSVSDKFYDDLLAYYTGDSKQNIDDILADYVLKHMSAGGKYIDEKGNFQSINENSTDEQRRASIINSGSYKTNEEIDENIQRMVTEWKEAFGEAGSELNEAFTNAARVTTETANAIETASKAITTTVLQDNQKVQNSKYSDDVIDVAAKQYARYYQEAFKQKSDEGFGTIGVNQGDTEKDEDAQRYFKEYIEALGKNIDDYELTGVTGDDEARKYHYKTKDGTEAEIDINGMIDAIITSELKGKINEFSNGLIDIVELIDNSINNATDEIQKKSLEATKDFLLNQDFYDSSLLELNELQNYLDTFGSVTNYLNSIFGGQDQLLSDEEAQALGYNSAKEMIRAFENTLKEVDLSNFSQTIQDIVDKGADLTAATAAAYDNMTGGDFGTTDADTFVGPMPQGMDYDAMERNRFDIAVQGGLSEDPKEMTEELTRMVELLEQAPAGFQNLSEAADQIDSSSVAEFNEELQDAIDTFNDYGALKFTDIADGIIDEDEAKDLDVNMRSLDKYVDMLEETEEGAGKTRDELMELAEASLKTAKAFSDLKDDWKDYRKNLQSGDIAKQADAIAKVGDAFKGVFGFDLSELDISDTFLTDAENIQLVEDAINGVDGALERLQGKLFTEIFIDAVGEENVQNVINELIAAGVMLEGQSFEAAFTADPSGFLTALSQSENAAKISASAIQAAVSSMGYSMTYETETADVTQTAETDGGYSWQTVPGTPFEYEYVRNTAPGEEPVKDSITITPIGLQKVPNAPVEVSTTQLSGGSATNYQFGDGTSTNNTVSMADIKNISVTKKKDTPTSGSVKGASPLVGSGSSPAGGGGGKGGKGGGGGGGGGSDKPKKPTKAKTVEKTDPKEKDEEVERYKEITEVLDDLNNQLDEIGKKKDEAWGPNKIAAMEDELITLNNLTKAQEVYIKQIGTIGKDGKALDGKLLDDQKAVEALGGRFDQFGRLVNYSEIMGNLVDTWNSTQAGLDAREQAYENSVAAVANTEYAEGQEAQQWAAEDANEAEKKDIDDARDQADKDYEKGKKAIEQYIETLNLSEEAQRQLEDYQRQIKELNYEKLMYKVEFKVEVNERELKILDHYASRIEDNFYKTAEVMAKIQEKSKFYESGEEGILDDLQAQLIDLEQAFKDKQITQADYIEGLGKIQDMAMENVEALYEMNSQMREYYADVIDEGISKIQEMTDHFDHLASKLEHYQSILSLMGFEQDYEKQNDLLQAQIEVLDDRIKTSQQLQQVYRQNLAEDQANYDKAVTEEDKQYYLERIQQWSQALEEEEDTYLDYVEQTAEAANKIRENSIKNIFRKIELEETNGVGYDAILDSMERLNTLSDEYLTNTNKMYETNKMISQAQLAIDKTQNKQAQQKYQNYIKYIEKLQVSGNLSQNELKIAQARYKVLEAEIALEEAKNAKSEVRLTRDSEGNFGYVYTANQDAVGEATQNYLDAQNEIYNIGLENTKNYQEKIMQLRKQSYEEMMQLELDYASGLITTEEEYNYRKQAISETAGELLVSYQESLQLAQFTLATTSYDTLMKEDQQFYDGQQSRNREHTSVMSINDSEYYDGLELKATTTQQSLQEKLNDFNIGVLSSEDVNYITRYARDQGYYDDLKGLVNTTTQDIKDMFNNGPDSLSHNIQVDFYNNLNSALADCKQVTQEWQVNMSSAVEAVGTSLTGEDIGLTKKIQETLSESKKLKEYITGNEGLIEGIDSLWDKVGEMTLKWIDHWGTLQSIITAYDTIIQQSQTLIQSQAGEIDYTPSNPPDTPYPIEDDGSGADSNSGSGGGDGTGGSGSGGGNEALLSEAATILHDVHYGQGHFTGISGGWVPTAEKYYSAEAIKLARRAFTDSKPGGGYDYYYNKAKELLGSYDTGGYTGEWGPEGKLAVLHEKELVLNAQDTENFLTATTMLRQINQMLDNNALLASLGMINLSAMTLNTEADKVLQQDVTIHADFPNVTDHTEIEMAIDNLINAASQYANRK